MAEESDVIEYPILNMLGGLSTTKNAPLIEDSEWQSAINVLFDEFGGPRKRYGYSLGANPPFSTNAQRARIFTYTINSQFAADEPLITNGTHVWRGNSAGEPITWTPMGYKNLTATATFTNGSPTVTRSTGVSEWLSQVAAGDRITADGGTNFYTISVVNNNDTITLSTNFAESTTTTTFIIQQPFTSSGTGGSPDAVMFQGKLYMGPATDPTSGTSGLYSYDGFEIRRVASSARLDNLVVHKNYIFGFYSSGATPSRTIWCDLLDPTTWPAANFADVSPMDGSKNRRLISFNDVLYVFRDQNIFYFTGEVFDPSNPTFALRRIINPRNIGTLHGRTCCTFNGGIMFLGQQGVFFLQGISNIIPISYNKINSDLYNIGCDTVQPNLHSAEVFDNKYWLGIGATRPSNSYPSYSLDLNGAWSRHTMSPTDLKVVRIGNGIPNMFGWDNTNSAVIVMSTSLTDDGLVASPTAISATLSSKVFTFGDFTKTNSIKDLYVIFKNSTSQAATVSVYDDSGIVGTGTAVSFTGGSTQFIQVLRIQVDRDTSGFYFTITDATLSKSFTVYGAMIVLTKDARGSGVVVT